MPLIGQWISQLELHNDMKWYYIYNIIHIFRLIKHGIRLTNDMIKMEYDVRLVYNNIIYMIYIYDILPLISHWSPANGTPPLSRTSPCARANSSAFTRNRSRNGMWHGGRGGAIFQKWATAQLAQLLAMFCRENMGKHGKTEFWTMKYHELSWHVEFEFPCFRQL